jgi:DNA-binding MarR family transcriptional regulator
VQPSPPEQIERGEREGAGAEPADVARQLGDLMRTLFLDPRADHLGLIEERELSMTQVRALVTLTCCGRPLSTGELAQRLGLSAAAMSRALDGLDHRELVSRSESASDRRVRLVEISPPGEAIVEEIVALRSVGLERFVADLDPEQRALLSRGLAAVAGSGRERR